MARIRRQTPIVPAALGAVLLLAACNSSDGGSSGDLSYEDSPLNEYYSSIYSVGAQSEEEMRAENEEMDRRMEELTAECMADLGFEYNPQNNSTTYYYESDSEDQSPQEYAQQYGYGITTWEDTPQGQEMAAQEEEMVYEDPNADLLESMSPAEQEAWYAALYGEPDMTEYDPDAEAEYEYDWESAGCIGAAQQEVYVESPYGAMDALYTDPQFAELFEAMNNLYQDAQNDPAMRELDQEWSGCMADAGFDFANPQAAQESIIDLSNAAYEDYEGEEDENGEWIPPDLTDLKQTEIDTAVADYDCQEQVDYSDRSLEVQFAIEQEFVDANRDQLDALVAAAQDAQGTQE